MIFKNSLDISVIRGGAEEVTHIENSVADDFLCGLQGVYMKGPWTPDRLQAVLLPDGPRWDSWTWDPRDPWTPYPCLANHPNDTEAVNIHQQASYNWDSVQNKARLSYQWTKLDQDFALKAVGLTNWDWFDNTQIGVSGQGYTCIPVATIAVLPQPLVIKGRNSGAQVPDILQVSYYLSLIGV
jgi:hypothetical protein